MRQYTRAIEWWLFKRTFLRIVSEKLNPLIAYPMSVWVFFSGREEYLKLGYEDFKTRILEKSKELVENLVVSLLPEEKKPIEKRYRSITQSIECTRRWRKQQIAEQTEKSWQVDQMDKLLQRAKFINGEAKLN